MNEKTIERKLRIEVKKLGGKAVKFSSPFETGYPDRICLFPDGKVFWCETKTTKKKLSPRQKLVKQQLESFGFHVAVVDDQESLDKFLKHIIRECRICGYNPKTTGILFFPKMTEQEEIDFLEKMKR